MTKLAGLPCIVLLVGTSPVVAAGAPSRPAFKGCAWERISNAALGLEAWVQQCDYGSRKIDFLVKDSSLAIRYSDGGSPEPLVDVLALLPAETPEAGVKRLFEARTEKAVAKRCVMVPYSRETRAGAKRLTFVPDPAYSKELQAKADPNEVPDPPCGDWGDAPDGIQYFETQPASGARKVLFVRIGQDEPPLRREDLAAAPRPLNGNDAGG